MSDPATDAISLVLAVLLAKDQEAVALLKKLYEPDRPKMANELVSGIPQSTIDALKYLVDSAPGMRTVLEGLE